MAVPQAGRWFMKLFAFMGPGYMVSVGYMDPGNWATDIAGGAQFGYTLLFVIMLSNLMAILLQALSARLGIVTGRDLAQACRAYYPKPVAYALWFLCELAIIACDLAEVIGTAIALNLLFGIPLMWGAIITALDAFLVLYLMNRGFRVARGLHRRAPARHLRLLRHPDRRRLTAHRGGDGRAPARARDRDQPGDALHRHGHHRRHGDAAQPLPALLDRADPRLSAHRRRQARRDQVGDHRLDHRADAGALRQRLDPHRRGRRLPRHRQPGRRPRSSAPTSSCRRSSASASPRSSSPWRCSPRASTRR